MFVLYNRLIAWLSSGFHNQKAVSFFCKALQVFTILKILFLWKASQRVVVYHHLSMPHSWLGKIIFFPSVIANDHLSWVYIAFIALLIISFFLRWNYLSGAVFFWITLNLYRINIPLLNGSDQVQVVLAGYMMFMATLPRIKSNKFAAVQILVFNMAVLLAQLTIVFVYFISGWDKLTTASWRTGDAFLMISNLQHLINPYFKDFLLNHTVNAVLAWITILFELFFAVLVWFKNTRLLVLITGILFHIVIAIMLNLPEFSIIMIIAYMIFLNDSDYIRVRAIVKSLRSKA